MRILLVTGFLIAMALPEWAGPIIAQGCTDTPGSVSLYYGYFVGQNPEVICAMNFPGATQLTPQSGNAGTGISGVVSYGSNKATVTATAAAGLADGAFLTQTFLDTLHLTGPAGILELQVSANFGVDLSPYGSALVEYTFALDTQGTVPFVSGIPGLVQNADGTLSNGVEADGLCSAFSGVNTPGSCGGSYTASNGTLTDFTSNDPRALSLHQNMTVRIPYASNGFVYVTSDLLTECGAGSFVSQSTESCSLDAGHSFYIGGAKLFQLDGTTPMVGGGIISGSGFAYDAALPGGGGGDPGAVPEPGTAALLAIGSGLVFAARLTRRKRG